MKISAQTGPQNATGSTDTISVRTSNVNIDIQLVAQTTRSSSFATQQPIIHQRRTEPYRFVWRSHDPNDPRNATCELPCIEEEKPGVQDTG